MTGWKMIVDAAGRTRSLPLGKTALLAGFFAAGCATMRDADPQAALRRFPIGIYNVSDPGLLPSLKENGFDTFMAVADGDGQERLAKAARRHGMRMVLSPGPALEGPAGATKGWPILAWYLQDEPDVNKVSPETLAERSERVRGRDPGRLRTFVVGSGAAAAKYGSIGDVLMLDWYPVPHRPLETVEEQIELAARSLPKGKPLWMVVQAFDWREDASKPAVGRFPTHEEIRFMSYLSILSGAKGLFYFRLQKPGGKTLLDYPELWQALTKVTREIKLLQPVLENGRLAPLPFQPTWDGPRAMAWRFRGRDYLVIANRKKTVYQRVPDELLLPEWRPLFSQRRDAREFLSPIGKGFYLRPHQVLVLESRSRGETGRTW
ncbi:MAG: hypothetical protein HY927_13455 [Elusimicrobia bacterium]|nr:hypothetical protein [Elusimicrobiota bacterium]